MRYKLSHHAVDGRDKVGGDNGWTSFARPQAESGYSLSFAGKREASNGLGRGVYFGDTNELGIFYPIRTYSADPDASAKELPAQGSAVPQDKGLASGINANTLKRLKGRGG